MSGRAFGLDLELPQSMGIALPVGDAVGSRRTEILEVDRRRIESLWRSAGPYEHMRAHRFTNGRPMMSVDHAPRLGYRIWGIRHGRYLVSPDGSTIHAAPRYSLGWAWQRLLFAQALPLAAVLQGLEPLHASAVARAGYAVGFTAASGTGKTSLATHLIARGADLVADDVLVVEPTPAGPLAHPAAGLISVAQEQYDQLSPQGRLRLGRSLGGTGKLVMLAEPCAQPLPLLALFVLERHSAVESLRVRRLPTADPRVLLSSSFITYVREGRRLRRHLEACAALAETVAICRVEIPPTAGAADVAARVEEYVDELAAGRC